MVVSIISKAVPINNSVLFGGTPFCSMRAGCRRRGGGSDSWGVGSYMGTLARFGLDEGD